MTDRPIAKILCAGGAVQDIVMRVETFPQPGNKVQASDFLVTSGGQSGNAAVAAARLGAQVSYAGALGDSKDEVASRIVATMEREGIDCSGALRVAGASSSVSIIMLDAAGEKMIATRRDSGLGDVAPRDAKALAAGKDAVLADNRYVTFSLPVCEAAKTLGIPRVLDFDKPTPLDDALLRLSTHVIASADAAREATGEKDLRRALTKFGDAIDCFIAVTDGPAGYYWLEGDQVKHRSAFKVDAIDTLGAGDAFHGAFTVGLVETRDVVAAMRFASAAAAIKCTRFGGLMGAATRNEVEELLRTHPAP